MYCYVAHYSFCSFKTKMQYLLRLPVTQKSFAIAIPFSFACNSKNFAITSLFFPLFPSAVFGRTDENYLQTFLLLLLKGRVSRINFLNMTSRELSSHVL